MKTITQAEFDAFPVVNGIRECPNGDYSQIKSFGAWCSFGEGCRFGEGCSFGAWCSFGAGCSFGAWCSFGEGCSFGAWCSFGAGCKALRPFWSFPAVPPFQVEGPVLPTEECRAHWEERLGMKLSGCYDQIAKKIKPRTTALLKRKTWTKWERAILESWK